MVSAGEKPVKGLRIPAALEKADRLTQRRLSRPRRYLRGRFGPRYLVLEGKRQPAPDHSEIVPRPVDHTPADVVSPTNVAHHPELQSEPELAH
jgi:hypothetical protein